jgi:hypothetical protein
VEVPSGSLPITALASRRGAPGTATTARYDTALPGSAHGPGLSSAWLTREMSS